MRTLLGPTPSATFEFEAPRLKKIAAPPATAAVPIPVRIQPGVRVS
jgi:hypothetical protein